MGSPSAMSELVNVNPALVVCALIELSRIFLSAADAAAQPILPAGEGLASAEGPALRAINCDGGDLTRARSRLYDEMQA